MGKSKLDILFPETFMNPDRGRFDRGMRQRFQVVPITEETRTLLVVIADLQEQINELNQRKNKYEKTT